MATLDYEYLDGILKKARAGDGNAFAELYTATYQTQYHLIYQDTRDARLALDILLKLYITALQDIDTLESSRHLLGWLDEIRWNICENIFQERGQEYKRSSQTSVSTSSPQSLQEGWLDSFTANQVLTHILSVCGLEASDVPVDVLESWKNYIKPGIYRARYVVYFFLAAIILLPVLFIKPSLRMEWSGRDISGYAEYTIQVGSLLPVHSIEAELNGRPVHLDKMGFRKYNAVVEENGKLVISAETLNGQLRSRSYDLCPYDIEAPVLAAEDRRGEKVYLTIRETYSGIDYEGIKGLAPVSYDGESGVLVFMIPEEETEVTIPDQAGNELKVSIKP